LSKFFVGTHWYCLNIRVKILYLQEELTNADKDAERRYLSKVPTQREHLIKINNKKISEKCGLAIAHVFVS